MTDTYREMVRTLYAHPWDDTLPLAMLDYLMEYVPGTRWQHMRSVAGTRRSARQLMWRQIGSLVLTEIADHGRLEALLRYIRVHHRIHYARSVHDVHITSWNHTPYPRSASVSTLSGIRIGQELYIAGRWIWWWAMRHDATTRRIAIAAQSRHAHLTRPRQD